MLEKLLVRSMIKTKRKILVFHVLPCIIILRIVVFVCNKQGLTVNFMDKFLSNIGKLGQFPELGADLRNFYLLIYLEILNTKQIKFYYFKIYRINFFKFHVFRLKIILNFYCVSIVGCLILFVFFFYFLAKKL